jgi:hypothetical protein
MTDADPTTRRAALVARLEELAPEVIELVHVFLDAASDGKITPIEWLRIIREAGDVVRAVRSGSAEGQSPDRLR